MKRSIIRRRVSIETLENDLGIYKEINISQMLSFYIFIMLT